MTGGSSTAKGCAVSGCGNPHASKGWCSVHAWRVRKYGNPHTIHHARGVHPIERMLSRVEIDLETGCWLYPGTVNRSGYARVWSAGRFVLAHRAAYEFWVGPIPDGYTIDHVWARGCRHLTCVFPDHLEAVTASENLRRRWAAQRTEGRG